MAVIKVANCGLTHNLNKKGEVELFDTELRALIGEGAEWSYDFGSNELVIIDAAPKAERQLIRYGQVKVMQG